MSFYRNGEGYFDPSAGAALTVIAQKQKRLAKIKRRNDFEKLCAQFEQQAKKLGFEFPGQIWLRDKKSGIIFKGK